MPEPEQILLPELEQFLSEPVPGLALLRYHDVWAFRELLRGLRERGVAWQEVAYQPRATDDRGAPDRLVQRCRELAGSGAAVIFLRPDPEGEAANDLEAQAAFWKEMNTRREALGALPVPLVLTLDDTQTAACFHHGKDLVSWCSPKFDLPHRATAGRPTAVTEKSAGRDVPASSALTWDTLYPQLLKELQTGQPLSARAIQQLLFPLMEYAVDNGAVARASRLLPFGDNAAFPNERERGRWLDMKGNLATAQGNLPEAQRLFGEALRIRQRLVESDPANAAWQRDLSVSYWKLANLCEGNAQAVEAQAWWRKAHDTLAGMQQRGIMQPIDAPHLETLRAKVAGP